MAVLANERPITPQYNDPVIRGIQHGNFVRIDRLCCFGGHKLLIDTRLRERYRRLPGVGEPANRPVAIRGDELAIDHQAAAARKLRVLDRFDRRVREAVRSLYEPED